MSTVPRSDSALHYLEGLNKLEAARGAITAILLGHWEADPDVTWGIQDLLLEAEASFRWARLTSKKAA